MLLLVLVVSPISAIDSPTATLSESVIAFASTVPIAQQDSLLKSAGAVVIRALSCTTGVIAKLTEEGKNFLSDKEGVTVHSFAEMAKAHGRGASTATESARQLEERARRCNYDINYRSYKLTRAQVRRVKRAIRDEIARGDASFDGSQGDTIGAILRLFFHDAAPANVTERSAAGLNGCVDLTRAGVPAAVREAPVKRH